MTKLSATYLIVDSATQIFLKQRLTPELISTYR